MKIKFTNVGRDKKSWEEDFPKLNYSYLHKSVRKNNALASRYIDFDLDEDEKGGYIIAGMREVGRFEIIE